jgi:hypothetical protein
MKCGDPTGVPTMEYRDEPRAMAGPLWVGFQTFAKGRRLPGIADPQTGPASARTMQEACRPRSAGLFHVEPAIAGHAIKILLPLLLAPSRFTPLSLCSVFVGGVEPFGETQAGCPILPPLQRITGILELTVSVCAGFLARNCVIAFARC